MIFLNEVLCFLMIAEGEPVKMRCKIEAQPLPEVTWYLNENPIISGAGFNIISDLHEFFLTIPHATMDMNGRYTIKAKNKYGETECCTVLTVEGINTLLFYKEISTILRISTISLDC